MRHKTQKLLYADTYDLGQSLLIQPPVEAQHKALQNGRHRQQSINILDT